MKTVYPIETSTVITRVRSVVSADIGDGEIVMMNVEKGMYYGMDNIESHIWELMECPLSVSQLCDTLMERYDVTREVCQEDVLGFLHQLHEEGLVEFSNPG